jgi:AMP deaminase
MIKNKLSNPHVRWMIQIPRLYAVYKSEKIINTFQDMIDNIFKPLFDVTINPALDLDLYQALF